MCTVVQGQLGSLRQRRQRPRRAPQGGPDEQRLTDLIEPHRLSDRKRERHSGRKQHLLSRDGGFEARMCGAMVRRKESASGVALTKRCDLAAHAWLAAGGGCMGGCAEGAAAQRTAADIAVAMRVWRVCLLPCAARVSDVKERMPIFAVLGELAHMLALSALIDSAW